MKVDTVSNGKGTLFRGRIKTQLVIDNWHISTVNYYEAFYNLMKDPQMFDLMVDIKKNGIKEPIVLGTGGFILEGRHRFIIVDVLGIPEVPYIFEDKPPNLAELERLLVNFSVVEEDYRS